MEAIREIALQPAKGSFPVAIVVSRFNPKVTTRLLEGAKACLLANGFLPKDITVVWVSGAFEIPQMVRRLLQKKELKGIIPLGCVIRGETTHNDYVSEAACSGVARLALESDTCISLGILTTETRQQAMARSGGAKGNKGWDAAEALLSLIHACDVV